MVVVEYLLKREDGSIYGVGHSELVPMETAIKLIEAKEAKAEVASIGVIPKEWKISKAGEVK